MIRTRKSGKIMLVDVVSPFGLQTSTTFLARKFKNYTSKVKRIIQTDPHGLRTGMWLVTKEGADKIEQFIRSRKGSENFVKVGMAIYKAENETRSGMVMPFEFDGKTLRSVLMDDVVHFVAKDAAEMLGYKNQSRDIDRHCKYVKILKSTETVLSDIPARGLQIIPEGDLWRLIIKSKLPEAEKIEEWAMDVVLPTIRKTGGFISDHATIDQTKCLHEKIESIEKRHSLEMIASEMRIKTLEKIVIITKDAMKNTRTFNAKFESKCQYCGEVIKKGQKVGGKIIDGRYEHVCHIGCFDLYVDKKINKRLEVEVF